MRKTIFGIIISLVVVTSTWCAEQTPGNCYPVTKNDLERSGAPLFSDYPTKQERLEAYAPINFKSNPRAKTFRTVLKKGILSGPNFAGHYVVVGWGCGSACVTYAIVNLKTGKVIFPEGIYGVVGNHIVANDFASEGNSGFWGLRYRIDSRLLIVIGMINEDKNREGAFYYKLEDDKLKDVFDVKIKKEWCIDK